MARQVIGIETTRNSSKEWIVKIRYKETKNRKKKQMKGKRKATTIGLRKHNAMIDAYQAKFDQLTQDLAITRRECDAAKRISDVNERAITSCESALIESNKEVRRLNKIIDKMIDFE